MGPVLREEEILQLYITPREEELNLKLSDIVLYFSCCGNVSVIEPLTEMFVLQVKVAQQSPVDSDTILREPTTKSLLVNNLPERSPTDSPREGLRVKRGRLAPNPKAGLEPKGSDNCKVQ